MGVLNCTPDSFFDGGRYGDTAAAIAHGRALIAEGAAVVDVGGESSRPGADEVPADLEASRVLEVVAALAGEVRVSVDTVKAEVARAAVAAGASIINDVSGALAPVAAEAGVAWVAMHRQGSPKTMQVDPSYDDVVAEVHAAVLAMAKEALALGVEEVYVDPGIGFGKTTEHNLTLLAHLPELAEAAHAQGCGVMVGTSRKRFLGALGSVGGELPPEARLPGSLATASWLALCGVDLIRVHDVEHTVRAVRLARQAREAMATW